MWVAPAIYQSILGLVEVSRPFFELTSLRFGFPILLYVIVTYDVNYVFV